MGKNIYLDGSLRANQQDTKALKSNLRAFYLKMKGMKIIKYTISKERIEEIWAKENESLNFANKFKLVVHLGFKGEEALSRWEKVKSEVFLRTLEIDGTLKRIYFHDEDLIIETL